MRSIKRVVDTGFWSDEKVMEFSPEDKYFLLFLLTNEYTTQLGIYYLPIKKAAFDLGYSEETVKNLLHDFEYKYQLIRYSTRSGEVALKNYLLYSVVSGGKPVLDCLERDARMVRDKSLLTYIVEHLKSKDVSNSTVLKFIDTLKDFNDNDNDNDSIVNDSSTIREKPTPRAEKPKKQERNIIPPSLEMVQAYCEERHNGIDAQHFLDYYDARGWIVGKAKMKDWQATVRTWEGNDKKRSTERVKPKPNMMTQMLTNPTSDEDLDALLERITVN